jgi:7-carboxy-7-deazaguanine synthase
MTEFTLNEWYPCHLGEGIAAGLPALLIRFAGCNLACRYCDTKYACTESGAARTVDEMLVEVEAVRLPRVLLTGGEPLLQRQAVQELAAGCRERNVAVVLETNGTLPIAGLSDWIEKVVDVKVPGAGAGLPFLNENVAHLGPLDQLKFVLTDRRDYEFARGFIRKNESALNPERVLFSTVWQHLKPATLSSWLLADSLPVRFHIQIHKAVWGNQRGV